VLNQNTIWQTDFVTWSLVAATFVGSPYVLLTKGHVNVDVLPHYLGPRARWWLALASILMSLFFCVVLTLLTSALLAAGLGKPLGVGNNVARALWIPYSSMADRPGHPYAAVRGRPVLPRHRREPPFGIKENAAA